MFLVNETESAPESQTSLEKLAENLVYGIREYMKQI